MKYKDIAVNKEEVIQSLKNAGITVVENEGSSTRLFDEDGKELHFHEKSNLFGFIMGLPQE